jgi:hypothetical protein
VEGVISRELKEQSGELVDWINVALDRIHLQTF